MDWGFDGVEFRRKRVGIQESVEEYLDCIVGAAAKSKMKCVIFGASRPGDREHYAQQDIAYLK